jgi:hypothetical protein
MEEARNLYRSLVKKSFRKCPLRELERRWENDSKMEVG